MILVFRTLDERAKRLFSTKGKKMEELDQSLLGKKPGSSTDDVALKKEKQKHHDVAALEAQVYHLSELVGVIII